MTSLLARLHDYEALIWFTDIVTSYFAGHSNKCIQERVIVVSILVQGIKREEPERKFHKPGICEKVIFFCTIPKLSRYGHAVLQIFNISISFRIMRAQDSNTVFHIAFFHSSNSKGKNEKKSRITCHKDAVHGTVHKVGLYVEQKARKCYCSNANFCYRRTTFRELTAFVLRSVRLLS